MTFYGFDKNSTKKIADAVTRLKYQQENIHKQVRNLTNRADQNALQLRTAITGTTPDVPVYPTTGCLFPFTIHDLEFDPTATDACDPTNPIQWSTYHTGRTIDGTYIAEGTEVLFVEMPTSQGHRFWIFTSCCTDVLVSPVACYKSFPKAAAKFFLWEFDAETCTWAITATQVDAIDQTDVSGLILPGEPQWATLIPGCDEYQLRPNRSKRRRAENTAGDILCGTPGPVEIYGTDTCTTQTNSGCTIDVCNDWGERACIGLNTKLEVEYVRAGVWAPVQNRNSIFVATLVGTMCPDAVQGTATAVENVRSMDYCMEAADLLAITTFQNENNHAGSVGDTVYGFRDNTTCDNSKIYIFDVKKKCQDLAAPMVPCDGNGVFMYRGSCSISGSVRKQNAIESCTDAPVILPQLDLVNATVMESASISAAGCDVAFQYQEKQICVFEDNIPTPGQGSGFSFGRVTLYDSFSLGVDPGGGGSQPTCDGKLVLKGTVTEALTLTNCTTPGGGEVTLAELPLTPADVVHDISWDGCPSAVEGVIYTLGSCGPEIPNPADCTECDEDDAVQVIP